MVRNKLRYSLKFDGAQQVALLPEIRWNSTTRGASGDRRSGGVALLAVRYSSVE